MKKKALKLTTLFGTAFLTLCSCDISSFLRTLDSLTAGASFDSARANLDAGLSYIQEGNGFKASNTKYIYEDILDTNGNYPCPSVPKNNEDEIKILVIPVEIKGYESAANAANLNRINKAFFGSNEDEDVDWESVSSFYERSSYGQLKLSGVVADEWYKSGLSKDDLRNLNAANAEPYDATWTILRGAVSWYKEKYASDCREFDYDQDGRIDGVWLVYSCPHEQTNDAKKLFWAYNYKDYQANDNTTFSPVGFSYCWASIDFMNNGYDKTKVDAHTYIHETGHLLGLDDYYVASRLEGEKNYGPLGAIDMMDMNIVDHNAFSKYALGWTRPYVVSDTTEITLKPSATTGQAIILPTSKGWHDTAFDEYVMMEYYTPVNLNYKDSLSRYNGSSPQAFSTNGVRIYHVDARMAVSTDKYNKKTFEYSFDLDNPNKDKAMIMQSNSSAYNERNRSEYFMGATDPNFNRYRLIQQMDCGGKRNFDTMQDTLGGNKIPCLANNATLFTEGKTFSFEEYKESFPNYVYGESKTMNNGGTLPWTVEFGEQTNEGIKVKITKIL